MRTHFSHINKPYQTGWCFCKHTMTSCAHTSLTETNQIKLDGVFANTQWHNAQTLLSQKQTISNWIVFSLNTQWHHAHTLLSQKQTISNWMVFSLNTQWYHAHTLLSQKQTKSNWMVFYQTHNDIMRKHFSHRNKPNQTGWCFCKHTMT